MKLYRFTAVSVLLLTTAAFSGAQNPSGLKYTDANLLTVVGQGSAVRFSSNSTCIGAKWAGDGICGIDLYKLDGGQWKFTGVVSPSRSAECNPDGDLREYLAFLPSCGVVDSLAFGCEPQAVIALPQDDILTGKGRPYVFCGTAANLTGCVSRPGLTYPAIISRRTGRESIILPADCIAEMDSLMAATVAAIDAEAYVVDCRDAMDFPAMRDSAERFISYVEGIRPQSKVYMVKTDLLGGDMEGTMDGVHLNDLGAMRLADELMKQMGLGRYVPSMKKDLNDLQRRNVELIALMAVLLILAHYVRKGFGGKNRKSFSSDNENAQGKE